MKVKNVSNSLWPAKGQPDGKFEIRLAYHWLDRNNKIIVFDGHRTTLPYDVKPGEEVTLDALVVGPAQPGDYILEFDMVQEMVAWFKDKGSGTIKVDIKVE